MGPPAVDACPTPRAPSRHGPRSSATGAAPRDGRGADRVRRYLSAMRLGMGEALIVLVIALLVFGPNRIPQLGDSLGKGLRSFKKAVSGEEPQAKDEPPRGT